MTNYMTCPCRSCRTIRISLT